jgi:hypothetical protein
VAESPYGHNQRHGIPVDLGFGRVSTAKQDLDPPRAPAVRSTRLAGRQRWRVRGGITRGNFRLLHRLLTQIDRIMKINGLSVVTNDVIAAAHSTLVIGEP